MGFMELAKARFSVRKFADKPVEQEKLDLLLEAGNIAPTAKNQQPQRIYVIRSKEALEKLADYTPCIYGAGTVLLFAYNTTEQFFNPDEPGVCSGIQDVSIVATHIMLEAEELGLSSCWVNRFLNSGVEKAFGLPEEEKAVLLLPVGYAAEGAVPTERHGTKKPIEETVRYL